MVLSFLVTMVATKGFSLVPPTTVSFSSCCFCFCFSVLFLRSFLSFTFAFSFSLSFLSLFFPLPCPFSCHDPYQPSADTVRISIANIAAISIGRITRNLFSTSANCVLAHKMRVVQLSCCGCAVGNHQPSNNHQMLTSCPDHRKPSLHREKPQ